MTEKKKTKKEKRPKDIEDMIGESGFPFQKEVERLFLENNSIFYPHQTEVPVNVPPEHISSKFVPPSLDIVLCQTSQGMSPKWSIEMLLECKKAYAREWYFFSKQSGSYYRSNRIPISAIVKFPARNGYEFRIKSIYCDTELFEMSKKPIVCDNIVEFQLKNGDLKDSDRKVAYEACGTLSIALFHFLKVGFESNCVLLDKKMNPDDISMVFPVLVTTAKLNIIDSTKLQVDLDSGKCNKDSINYQEVEWVFFEFPILPSIRKFIEPESMLFDFGKDLVTKMGCVIVNANNLLHCLSHFNPQFVEKVVPDFLMPKSFEFL